ncbi:hypothetical protein CLV44_1167 [Marinobacterium halophilum]|uniref:DNA-binding protein n=1 Tax=Marinobacterium halophilum TaxID=267374 RepID=A0A2P8ET43_9GAMM|nr:DNA-binding protein [Marinobacterium halophilum]PSL12649.1 hypothetical protein CLV44_1167 [Marinobacterium halophilum]
MSERALDRALLLLEQASLKDLAIPNSKEYVRWQNIKRGKARLGIDEAEALAKLYPQFALWLLTGNVAPEVGQTSPNLEEVQRSESGTRNAV